MSYFIVLLVAILFLFAVIIFQRHPRQNVQPIPTESVSIEPYRNSKAAVLFSKNGPYAVVNDWPRPRISPKELLIRNRAIGLNPIDWKCVAYGFGVHSLPWISGREAAGIVEEVGSEVHGFQKGDKVFVTSTNYRDNRTSTFQEYTAAFPFNVGRLPHWVSFEEGATLGVGFVAAAGALFDSLGITRYLPSVTKVPDKTEKTIDPEPPWVLIWGGSCVTGMMATQLAKQCNLRVFAVAGLQNASYLSSLGADRVLDRHQPEDAVVEARRLHIKFGIDCVGQETATHAVQALQPGGKLACLVKGPGKAVVEQSKVEVTDILIKRFHEDAAYGQSITDYISHCLINKTLQPVRHEVIKEGFEAIESGLNILKREMISGRKLVIRLNDDGRDK